jgi:hypothetical protein
MPPAKPKKPPKKPKPKKPKPKKPGGGKKKPNPDKPGRKPGGKKPRKPVRKPRRESRSGVIPRACRKLIDDPRLLDCWLEQHPKVADAIRWQRAKAGGGTELVAWPAWNTTMKARLRDAWMEARAWRAGGMKGSFGMPWTDPPPNQDPLPPGSPTTRTVLDGPSQAWPWFVAQVAACLAAEIEGWVPWSMRHLSAANLEHLYSSAKILSLGTHNGSNTDTDQPGQYVVGGQDSFERSTPAHPSFVWRWLATQDLVASTRIETIARVVDWCRWNMRHFLGEHSPDNSEAHWLYRGVAPVRRIIEGTLGSVSASTTPIHWTAGCGGTSGFLRSVLRNVNLPVLIRYRCSHALPYFAGVGRYLSHGDDPYNAIAKADYPAKDLLITQSTFDDWFPVDPADPDNAANQARCCESVGRRPTNLAVWHFAPALLKKYCDDKSAGLSHANGEVFEIFADKGYTVAQLEATNLWERLEAAAQAQGTC